MMLIFAFKKGELKEKSDDANLSIPIKNPNTLLKNGFQNWPKIPDPGFVYRLPTLIFIPI